MSKNCVRNKQKMNELFHSVYGEPPHQVECQTIICGQDVIVIVGGGTGYHIGALALSNKMIVNNNSLQENTSVNVITLPNHKEHDLVKSAVNYLSESVNCSVLVVAGLHIDNANKNDIDRLVENFDECIKLTKNKLVNHFSISV